MKINSTKRTRSLHLAFLVVSMSNFIVLNSCKDNGVDQPSTQGITFSRSVLPLFSRYRCFACHGTNGGLSVTSVSSLLRGGDHGPAVIPFQADSSLLIKKMSATPPFGNRMPRSGPYLSDKDMQIVKTWINEGAKNY